jgi:hypothetical protein
MATRQHTDEQPPDDAETPAPPSSGGTGKQPKPVDDQEARIKRAEKYLDD